MLGYCVRVKERHRHPALIGEASMSKGMDKKKESKKKPAKTLEEKRAAKREKREAKG